MFPDKKELPIGIFDSGAGGVSVLAEIMQCLPQEKLIYLADSANAPYGTKSKEEVKELSLAAARFLLDKGIKALVVACNTATSVAVAEMRRILNIPIVGMEPAVKPAVEAVPGGKVVVLATPLTLKEEKFCHLQSRFGESCDIIPLPCPGLVELVEQGHTGGPAVEEYWEKLFSPVNLGEVSSVVLGCTHYIFARESLRLFLGEEIGIFDGNEGTARQLKRVLEAGGLLREKAGEMSLEGRVEFHTTGEPEKHLLLYKEFLRKITEG